MAAQPGGAFCQVAHLVALLQADGIALELAVQVLGELGIHPWSLLGGYGAWAEVQRDWALRLGLPAACVAALGPRTFRNDETFNPAGTALRIPVDLGLEHLPEALKLKNLEIRHCPRLEQLGPGLAVQENLSLHACGCLEGLPGDLEVGGRLGITHCPSLREVALSAAPAAVHLADDLVLRELRLAPAFAGNLSLRGCPGLDTLVLPSGTLENFHLFCCGDLGPVPVARVRGSLWMEPFGGTACLPPGLQVEGSAWLDWYQDDPVQLPAGLRIGADLVLNALGTSSVTIPTETRVAGTVHLYVDPRHPRIDSIPGQLRVLPFDDGTELPIFQHWRTQW